MKNRTLLPLTREHEHQWNPPSGLGCLVMLLVCALCWGGIGGLMYYFGKKIKAKKEADRVWEQRVEDLRRDAVTRQQGDSSSSAVWPSQFSQPSPHTDYGSSEQQWLWSPGGA